MVIYHHLSSSMVWTLYVFKCEFGSDLGPSRTFALANQWLQMYISMDPVLLPASMGFIWFHSRCGRLHSLDPKVSRGMGHVSSDTEDLCCSHVFRIDTVVNMSKNVKNILAVNQRDIMCCWPTCARPSESQFRIGWSAHRHSKQKATCLQSQWSTYIGVTANYGNEKEQVWNQSDAQESELFLAVPQMCLCHHQERKSNHKENTLELNLASNRLIWHWPNFLSWWTSLRV